MSKKNKRNCNSQDPFADSILPPCRHFLGDTAPVIIDDLLVYRNQNRLFCFLSTSPDNSSLDIQSLGAQVSTNLQISFSNYLISLFIYQINQGKVQYDKNSIIHTNKKLNTFIHNSLGNEPSINLNYIPAISLLISNGNAVAPLYTNTINISPLNYYIILGLHALENNPGLFYGNNSFVLNDTYNIDLASFALKMQI